MTLHLKKDKNGKQEKKNNKTIEKKGGKIERRKNEAKLERLKMFVARVIVEYLLADRFFSR